VVAGGGGEQIERLPDLDAVGERRLLELAADAPSELLAVRARVQTQHADRAGIGRTQALEDLDRRGLAGAVRSDDAKDLVPLDAERQVIDGDDVTVGLAQVFDGDRGFHSCPRYASPSAPGKCRGYLFRFAPVCR
jgi:hypothetical protein